MPTDAKTNGKSLEKLYAIIFNAAGNKPDVRLLRFKTNNATLQQYSRIMWQGMNLNVNALLPGAFMLWDKFRTSLGQKQDICPYIHSRSWEVHGVQERLLP